MSVQNEPNSAELLDRVREGDERAAELIFERYAVGGTAGFMAPEQFDPQLGPIRPATDIYSLGAMLWTLLTTKLPDASARSAGDKVGLVAVPSALLAVCQRCLAVSPGERYADAASLLSALATRQRSGDL